MPGVTLAQAQQHLDDSQAALTAARKSLQYSVGDKQVIRANIDALSAQVSHWNRVVFELESKAAGASTPGFSTASWL